MTGSGFFPSASTASTCLWRRLLVEDNLVPGGRDRHQEELESTEFGVFQGEDLLLPRFRIRRFEGERERRVVGPRVGALVTARQGERLPLTAERRSGGERIADER